LPAVTSTSLPLNLRGFAEAVLSRGLWKRLLPLLALIKAGAGLYALTVAHGHINDPVYPWYFHAVFAVPFLATGILLIFGNRGDIRAEHLGGFFLMAATAFLNRPMRIFVAHGYPGTGLMDLLDSLEMDAFMAFFLWSFARDFPHPLVSQQGQRRIRMAVLTSLGAGSVLFALNLLNFLTKPGPLDGLVPMRGKGLYYSVLLPLTVAAFVFLYWRSRHVQGVEQRRIRLFLQALALSTVPTLAEILFGLFYRPYQTYKDSHPTLDHAIILVHAGLVLMLPLLTPYAVLVHQILDVRLLARRAAQYALARYTTIVLAAVPLAALAVYFYQHRQQNLAELFTGARLPLLISAAIIGFAALHYRKTLLDTIDRRFFREQYDAHRTLIQLLEKVRSTSGTAALATLIAEQVDLALHLDVVSLLILDPRSGVLAEPRQRSRRLDSSSPLAILVSDASEPLAIDLADPRGPLARLPDRDRHWLVDSGFKLIVPILARDGSLLGMLGLGEKRSGLPFLKEDRELLRAIANSAAWVIELEQTTRSTATPVMRPRQHGPRALAELDEEETANEPLALTELARECANCGKLYPSYTVLCSACSKRLEPSHVPYVLPGKFRFEKRIGIGGMGVVYRGSDLSLGRPVAVKTLRRVSPEDAMRLRREARTAASVSHSHLAPVYGMETWQGTPILVMELLEGGTLAHRLLDRGRLSALETVELGLRMTDALGHLHSADILHRDIKPSNIGYTRNGTPKLMDFGIARLMYDLRREREEGEMERLADDPSLVPSSSLWTHIDGITPLSRPLVGTLSYLCPEALEGKTPDALFDLWSLAMVLYECLLGRKVFSSADPRQTATRIRMGRVPDLSQLCPEYDDELAEFFRVALNRHKSRRPANAQELRQRLEAVREKVG
jgi:GAF domain-containing protein